MGQRMFKGVTQLGLVLCLVSGSVFAQQGSTTIGLEQAYTSALQNNFSLQSQRSAYNGEKEGVSESWAGVRPQIDASASYGESRFTRDFGVRESVTDSDEHTSYNVNLSQVVYSQRAFSDIGRAKASAARAAEQLEAHEREIGFSAIAAYLDYQSVIREIRIMEEEKGSHQRRLRQIEGLGDRGFATRADVLEAKATLDSTVAALVGLRTQSNVARQNLMAITGLSVGDSVRLEPVDESRWRDTPSILAHDWLVLALENAGDLRIARADLELAEARHDVERASHYPEVYLNARYTENDTFATSLREETRVEVQLRLPLYKGGSTSARSRQAAYRKEAAKLDLRHRERAVSVEVTRLVEGLKGSYDEILALEGARVSAAAALDAAERGFEAGVSSLTTVLDARARLSAAERERLVAIYDNLKMQFELKKVAGVTGFNGYQPVDETNEP